MNKTDAQKKAISEKYDKEGEINKKKHSEYDEEGGGDNKGKGGYRMKKDAKEEAGKEDKEGRVKHKCTSCGKMH